MFEKLSVLQVCSCCVMSVSSEELRVVCPNKTIKAVEKLNVSLPCQLDPRVDMSTSTVDWKRNDVNKVVHAYRHGQDHLHDQMDQYRTRTFLNHEVLRRGNLTLWISLVQLSDSGPYRCNVPSLNEYCIIHLTVGKHADLNTVQVNLGFLYSKCL